MATSLNERVVPLLLEIRELVEACGQARWAGLFAHLAEDAAAAGTESEGREVLQRIGQLFGGMGSFNDLVLQDRQGVRPEQQRLDALRTALYEAVSEVDLGDAGDPRRGPAR